MNGTVAVTRRSFLKCAAAGAFALAAAPVAGCSAAGTSALREVVDDTGRLVQIPHARSLRSAYFTSPLAQVFVFTVAPDLLAGTGIRFDAEQLEYLPQGTGELTYMGSLSNGGSIDLAALAYREVQLIFSISGVGLTDVNIADALALERETGIPVVLIDGSLDRIGQTYRLLGDCLGRPERAEQLATYCEQVYERVTREIARVPDDRRVTFYFAEGQEGLQTEPNASQHSVAFTTAGGINVAADLPYRLGSTMMANVSMDQVRQWDPEFIICWDYERRYGAARSILHNESWAGIRAVKDNRVYNMPATPFAFCDRPPGVNRLLGIQWLANLFYPEYYDVNMVDVVREFYARCYWREITSSQAQQILRTGSEGA